MDQMSLFAILTVSVPEHILNIILALLITGQKKHLKLTKDNLIKFSLAVILMTILICGFRANMPNFLFFLAFALFTYTFIFLVIYKFKFFHSFLCSIIIFGIIIIINIVFVPTLIMTLQKNLFELVKSNTMRFVLSLPERIIQLILVMSIWNTDKILINIKKYKPIERIASFYVLTLFILQIVLLYIATEYFMVLPKGLLFLVICLCILSTLANYFTFKLITIITKTVSLKVLKEQDKVNNMSFKVLYSLIKNKHFDKAVELCKKQMKSREVG